MIKIKTQISWLQELREKVNEEDADKLQVIINTLNKLLPKKRPNVQSSSYPGIGSSGFFNSADRSEK
jgi:hypothetical protein